MDRLTNRKIILITRKTRLESLIVRYNTIQQAKFFIEHSGSDFSDYVEEDNRYKTVVKEMVMNLEKLGNVQIVSREFLPNFIFGRDDIVVAVGQDGLVANTLKYLDEQPLIGINPDPLRWDGVLLPFKPDEAGKIVTEVISKGRSCQEITLAQVDLNDGQSLCAVNDLFIGQKSHVSARYTLSASARTEEQSSSGIIISTGLGSTGWFKSILAGVSGIASGCLHKQVQIKQSETIKWDSPFLYYIVREPYPSKRTSADLVFGKIDRTNTFKVASLMPEGGVIFSDGIENDYLEFNSGMEATVKIADRKGMLVV